jgi:hypothetical protein
MTDSSAPLPRQEHSAPGAPARQAAREAGTAAQKVAERVLLLDRPRYVDSAPAHLDPDHGGLVLCGQHAGGRARELRRAGYESILVIDQAAYETEAASADEPFALPEGRLFGEDLDDVLQGQLGCGADVAVTPTRYIRPGDADALKAVMRAARAIERSDVMVIVPVAITWLRDEYLRQLMAVLKRIPHPKALILGGQYNPLDAFANAPRNLRQVAQEVADLGLWRTDLAAFDCIAYGGLFAAIGAGGSVRHLIPEDEEPQSSSFPGAYLPSVLVPDLLRYSRADWLATKYANTLPPRCPCAVCDGSLLDRFNRGDGETRAAAHAHNAATWSSWLPDLFDHQSPGDRQLWWRNRCKGAVEAHEAENARIQQPGAFKPPRALRAWATLPVSQPPSLDLASSTATDAQDDGGST